MGTVGTGRALLSGLIPGWVRASYGVFGTMPDLALQFANGRGWQRGLGQGSARSFLTISRASTAYEDDTSGNWYSFASGLMRVTNKGALIEEARTNGIRDNSMQNAAAGTPGTLPTNWTDTTAGLTRSVIGVGTTNGAIDYIDLQYSGTTSSTSFQIAFDTSTAIAALTGQTWALSGFLAIVGGNLTNITTIKWRAAERDSGGGPVASNTGPDLSGSLTSSLVRSSYVPTLAGGASTAFLQPLLVFTCNNTSSVNFTIRIGWPQLELGAFATSPIRTTNAAATRAADVVTVTRVPTFGAFSAYVAFIPGAVGATNETILSIDDGTTSNRAGAVKNAAGNYAGLGVWPASGVALTTGSTYKAAAGIAASDQASSLNGAAVTTGSSALPTGINAIHIGCNNSSSNPLNGYITDLAVWASTRIPNAGLIAGTT